MILRFFETLSKNVLSTSCSSALICLTLLSSQAFAQVQDETSTVPGNPNLVKGFSGVASLNLRSSTASRSEYDYRIFLAPAINLEYAVEDVATFGFSLRGTKDLNNEQRYALTDLSVSASRSFELAEGLGLGIDGYYGAPVNKDLIKYSNAKGTLGATAGLSYAFPGALQGLAVSLGLGYERYLYEYQYANGGAILTKYSYSQTWGISYTYGKWTLAGSFADYTSFDFEGSQENDTLLAVETLKYKIDDSWSVQAGHINDGYTFDYLGAANNVKLYDKRRSQVFIGFSYRF